MFTKITGLTDYTGTGAGSILGEIDDALTAAGWTVSTITESGFDGILAESEGSTDYDFTLGVVIKIDDTEDTPCLIVQSAETFDGDNLVDENPSTAHKLFFTRNRTDLEANGGGADDIDIYIKADADRFALVIGNTYEDMYNAMFYGRLITPSGDPIDVGNSTAVDVECIAIGVSCASASGSNKLAIGEGKIEIRQDAAGHFWEPYIIVNTPIGNNNFWGGGPNASYSRWTSNTSWFPLFKELFLKESYWQNNISFIGIHHPREGFRGYFPFLFNMSRQIPGDQYVSEGEIHPNPQTFLHEDTADAGGTATSLANAGVDFTTLGIAVGDLVYHVSSRKFRKVTVVAATVLTTETLGADSWASADYKIYRGISFSVFRVGENPGTRIADQTIAVVNNTFGVAGSDYLVVEGDKTGSFNVGDAIEIVDSTANDGTYYIKSLAISTWDVVSNTTGTPGSDEFVIAGDMTNVFTAGRTFTVTDSTGNDGTFTVDSSSFAAGVTTIVVDEATVDDAGDGVIQMTSPTYDHTSIVLFQVLIDAAGDGYIKPLTGPLTGDISHNQFTPNTRGMGLPSLRRTIVLSE